MTTAAIPTPHNADESTMALLGLRRPAPLPATEPETSASGLLERVRALVPRRALTDGQARTLAERQAAALRRALKLTDTPKLPTGALHDLPFLHVTYRAKFPTSGMATRTGLGWVIVIRSDEPQVRQRFSLAHELKHLLDDPFMRLQTTALTDGLYPDTALATRHERTERICDAFAAALLMPRALIRRDWVDGHQAIPGLASRYGVSRPAMEIRLRQLGLISPTPRCAVPNESQDQ
ncbi:MAG: ImmA/IrrE family metallo-endopeptidase [Solirubrobacteraceae bacterium]|nr:ImmA/IrrE family metallo-endopeptidase [Solirubrobacteraceae bacterium]